MSDTNASSAHIRRGVLHFGQWLLLCANAWPDQ